MTSPFDDAIREALTLLADYVQTHIQPDHHIVIRLTRSSTTLELVGPDHEPLDTPDQTLSSLCRRSHLDP